MNLSHASAAWLMVVVTGLWSTAGVVARQLQSAPSFEVTFWRSVFTALSVALILRWTQGKGVWRSLRQAPFILWLSGLCWGVMYTAFMVALTLTTVAQVLITMALSPLLTAVLARVFLKQKILWFTWLSILWAVLGMAWMFVQPSADSLWNAGVGVAMLVPLSAASNWCLMQSRWARETQLNLLPAVFVGAVLSSLMTLPFVFPLQATWSDVGWLSLLGLFQLAIPCTLLVVCARVLPAHEISLLSLLEVLFGIALAWIFVNEVPSPHMLYGGTVVLLALLFNAWMTRRVWL